MYFPFLYGRQFELRAIRETADVLAAADFVPVIVPVEKTTMSKLHTALQSVHKAGGRAVVVVNSEDNNLTKDPATLEKFLEEEVVTPKTVLCGILLKGDMTSDAVVDRCNSIPGLPIALIHAGFQDAKALAEKIKGHRSVAMHIFMDRHCSTTYRTRFSTGAALRVLVQDGFKRQHRNSDYPETVEFFSELHITHRKEIMGRMDGFGDFLTIGETYIKGGGPAYAVVIHLTYIDPDQGNGMFVHHFLSKERNTTSNAAGKFRQALAKMIKHLDSPEGSKIFASQALAEFRTLHAQKHYPGLGLVKKLSARHHIETLADYFANTPPPDA